MKLVDLIHEDSIVPELQSLDRNGVIRELVEVLAAGGHIQAQDVESVVRTIVKREKQRGTTGFGKGVAAPHGKIEQLPRVVAALGRSSRGIDFQALDGGRVYTVILILSPAERPEEHLRAMDYIFRHLQQEKFRKFLRQSDTVEKLYDLLKEADESILPA
ncbi:MAG: PTS system fructose-specific EIIABC component [Phycisphaerae bacterium]|nr:PTS system fructose-specific EIIABC component [Phycisphaerae bacterium]